MSPLLVLSWLLLPAARAQGPAGAGEAAQQSAQAEEELHRLTRDMARLAERGIWKGVDQRYRVALSFEATGMPAPADTHLLGAEAARNLGDILALLERLRRAGELGAPVDDALQDIQHRFGRVELSIEKGMEGELSIHEEPFEMDGRQALSVARQALGEQRRFSGMLPVGRYTLCGEPFVVEAGDAPVQLALSRKRAPAATSRRPASRAAAERAPLHGIAHLGLGPAGATHPSSGLHPPGAFGLMPSLGGGLQLPVGARLGLRTELAWMALVGGASAGGSTALHLGVASLQLSWTLEDWALSAGPLYGVGGGSAEGLDEAAYATDCAENGCTTPSISPETARTRRLSGLVYGGGGLVGVERRLADLDGMVPALGLSAGALSDGGRVYPWGLVQLRLHLPAGS